MKTSRQRLFEYIQTHKVVTVKDLSRALRMTQANARHHLAILRDQGVVELIGQRPSTGKGRPAQLYSLSEQSQQHNLDRLVSALLQELLYSQPEDSQDLAMRNLAKRMLKEQPSKDVSANPARPVNPNLTQRLYASVRQLNDFNYQARWEAHSEAPVLIFEHCPYATILTEHPEMCHFDALLIEEMLGKETTQTAKLQANRRGTVHCMFRIGK